MKIKILLLLTVAVLSCSQIEAQDFLRDQWNRVRSNIRNNYYLQPYWESLELNKLRPENAAAQVASEQYLYGHEPASKSYYAYIQHLNDKLNYLAKKMVHTCFERDAYLNEQKRDAWLVHKEPDDIRKHNRAIAMKKAYTEFEQKFRPLEKEYDTTLKSYTIFEESLRKNLAELLNPQSFYEYQHPKQYILNN